MASHKITVCFIIAAKLFILSMGRGQLLLNQYCQMNQMHLKFRVEQKANMGKRYKEPEACNDFGRVTKYAWDVQPIILSRKDIEISEMT
jgi:hypothetical protein